MKRLGMGIGLKPEAEKEYRGTMQEFVAIRKEGE